MRRPLSGMVIVGGLLSSTLTGPLSCLCPTDRARTEIEISLSDAINDWSPNCTAEGAKDFAEGSLQVVGNSALLELEFANPTGVAADKSVANYAVAATLYFETGQVAAITTTDGDAVMTQGDGTVTSAWNSPTQMYIQFDALTQEGIEYIEVEVRTHDDPPEVCDAIDGSVQETNDGDEETTATSSGTGGEQAYFPNFCDVLSAEEIEAIVGVPVQLINMKDDDEHTRCWVESTDPTRSYQAQVETQFVQNWPSVLDAFREEYADAVDVRTQSWALEGELRLREFEVDMAHTAGLKALVVAPGAHLAFIASTSDDPNGGITGIGSAELVSTTEMMAETLAQAMVDGPG